MASVGPELIGRLMDEHGAALALYARQWSAAPEDIVQDAFVKLAGQRTLPVEPAAWLYRVVRNGAISAGRSERRRQQHESAAAQRAEPWFLPEHEGALDAVAAAMALRTLPPEQRESIVAHLWGGLTFEQVAALMGCSGSTAQDDTLQKRTRPRGVSRSA